MAVYKVGDIYLGEQGQRLGTEQDIQSAGGVSANLPWWAKGSVTSVPTRVQTTGGGFLAPSISYAAGTSGLSQDKVRQLFDAAGFQGFTNQSSEQFTQSINQSNTQAQNYNLYQGEEKNANIPLGNRLFQPQFGESVYKVTGKTSEGIPIIEGGSGFRIGFTDINEALKYFKPNELAKRGNEYIPTTGEDIQDRLLKAAGVDPTRLNPAHRGPIGGNMTGQSLINIGGQQYYAYNEDINKINQAKSLTSFPSSIQQLNQQQFMPQQTQFGQSQYTGPSIVDYLSSKGQNTSFSSRRQLAHQFNIPNYTGTPEQNTQLLNILRSQGQQPQQQQQGQPSQTGVPTDTGAPTTTGVPSPTGAPTGQPQSATQYQNLLSMTANLQAGAQGTEVQQLQQFLQSQGLDTGTIDGKLGPKTIAAVKAFQQSAGIAVDGIVGPITRQKIQEALSKAQANQNAADSGTLPPGEGEGETQLTAAETELLNHLQQKSFDDYVTEFGARFGLDGLNSQITAANTALQQAQDNMLSEVANINSNPWISDSLRAKKVAAAEAKHEGKLKFAQEAQQQAQKAYDNARQEIQMAAKMAVDQQNKDREFYYKVKQDALDAQQRIEDQKFKGPTSVQEYEYARSQGYSGSYTDYQNEDANRKISIAKASQVDTSGLSAAQIGNAFKLSDDYEQVSKEYYKQLDAYNRIVSSSSNPTAAGDLALIFNYMKVLDPGSTVREGEFANAQNAGSAFNVVGAQYNKVISGQRLTQAQRNDFVNRATTLFNGAKSQQTETVNTFNNRANRFGIPTDMVVRGINATGIPVVSPIQGNNQQHQTFWSNALNWLGWSS